MLIDYVSKRLGMNILYDATIAKKRFTIISPTEIPKDSLVDLMQSVLKMTGLAMVDGDQEDYRQPESGQCGQGPPARPEGPGRCEADGRDDADVPVAARSHVGG